MHLAVHSRNTTVQITRKLHGIEMTPAALFAFIVLWAVSTTDRAITSAIGIFNHNVDATFFQLKVNITNHPWRVNTEKLFVVPFYVVVPE